MTTDFLGLNPALASAKAASLHTQLPTIDHLISELTATHNAALHPHSYGIDPGETTIAPWSIGAVLSARNELSAARSVVAEMVQRIGVEIAAQQRTSGNAAGISGTAVGAVKPKPIGKPKGASDAGGFDFGTILDVAGNIKEVRRLYSGPRAVLQFSAAWGRLVTAPFMWRTLLHPTTWFSLTWYDTGRDFLSSYATNTKTNAFVRNTWRWANAFKPDWVFEKAGTSIVTSVLSGTRWLEGASSLVKSGAAFISRLDVVVGKGAGILGAGVGAYDLVTGIIGLTDGDATSEDAWQTADGAVGLICGIGSLAPPPVGVVFAAVGGAYALGRFLFSPLEDGKTPLEHMGSFFTDVGSNIASFGTDVLHNYGAAVSTTMHAAAEGVRVAAAVVSTTVENVGKTVSNAIDTAGKVFDALWPF